MIDNFGGRLGRLIVQEDPEHWEDVLRELVTSGMTKTQAVKELRGFLASGASGAATRVRGSSLEKHLAQLGAQCYADSSDSRNDAKSLVDANWEAYKAEAERKSRKSKASRNVSSGVIRSLANEIADLMYYSDDRRYGRFDTWDEGIGRIQDLLNTKSGRNELVAYMQRCIDQDSFSSDDAESASQLIGEIRSIGSAMSDAYSKKTSKRSKTQTSRNRSRTEKPTGNPGKTSGDSRRRRCRRSP